MWHNDKKLIIESEGLWSSLVAVVAFTTGKLPQMAIKHLAADFL